jgi:hypothetical protein
MEIYEINPVIIFPQLNDSIARVEMITKIMLLKETPLSKYLGCTNE